MNVRRLKAGALLYAIFVAIVTAVLLSSVLMLFYYRTVNAHNSAMQIQLDANVESALQLLKSKPALFQRTDTLSLGLYADQAVQMKHQWWGLYKLVKIHTRWKHLKASAQVLLGDDVFHGRQIAFYLKEDDNHLSVVGATKITGTAFLPKLGIRKGYIAGKTFSGIQPVVGEIKNSKRKLPELHNRLKDYGKFGDDQTKGALQRSFEYLQKEKQIDVPFSHPAQHFYADQAILLNGFKLKGKVIIESKYAITVGAGTELRDVVLIAPKIFIKQSKSSSLQAFARDTLIVGAGVKLDYPTSLCLMQNKSVLLQKHAKSLLKIEKGAVVEGNVIVNRLNMKNKALLLVENEAKLKGISYCNGETTFLGEQTGSLYIDELIYYGRSAIYKNHLLNAKINFRALPKNFSMGVLFHEQHKLMLMKWAN